MATISLVVNTRNEEHNLGGLLETAIGLDEIVIADMQSTDRTIKVALEHGARVLSLPDAGYCEPGRQPAIDAATSDWVLVLDADERLPPGAVDRLRSLVEAAPPSVGAFSFVFHVFVGQTRLLATGWDQGNERHPRLFRRGAVEWPPLVHYSPQVRGETRAVPEDEMWVLHHNFADLSHAFEKINRYSSIEARELLAGGRRPALLLGLQEAVAEFRRRYSPVEDGGLSFAMSLAIFVYRILVQAKAAESLEWPVDSVPNRDALIRGLETLQGEASRETILARPAGVNASPESSPAARGTVETRPHLARLLMAARAATNEATSLSAELLRARTQIADLEHQVGAARAEVARGVEQLELSKAEVEAGKRLMSAREQANQAQLERMADDAISARKELESRTGVLNQLAESVAALQHDVRLLRESAVRDASSTLRAALLGIVSWLRARGRRAITAVLPRRIKRFIRKRQVKRRAKLLAGTGLFDAAFYLSQNPDVAAAGISPIEHYLVFGPTEGRDPHEMFDTSYYLEQNPDVAAASLNPLLHFHLHGSAEGRRPHPAFSASQYRSATLGETRQREVSPTKTHETPRTQLSVARKFTARPIRSSGTVRPAPGSITATTLTITHVLPFPPRAGNEYRIHRMIKWLQSMGHEVHLVVSPLSNEEMSSEVIARAALEYPNLIICERDGTLVFQSNQAGVSDMLSSLNGTRPRSSLDKEKLTMSKRIVDLENTFCPDHLIDLVLRLEEVCQPDMVISNYVFTSKILASLKSSAFRVIDTIDVFSTKSSKVVRFGVADSLDISAAEEAALLRRADLIIAIQANEAAELRALAPDRAVVNAGVDFDFIEDASPIPDERNVLYVASNNALNVKGIRDFLLIAWPIIRHDVPDARMMVVGPVCESVDDGLEGVELLGRVERLDEVYGRAKVVVNLAVAGTGLKIKTVEALTHLRPIVAWPSGVDGLSTETMRFCDVAEDWYDFARLVVRQLLGNQLERLVEHRDQIKREFSAESVYADLKKQIEAGLHTARSRGGQSD